MNNSDKGISPILYYIGLITYMLYLLRIEIVWKIPMADVLLLLSIFCLTIHVIIILRLYKLFTLLLLIPVFVLCIIVGIGSHSLYLFYASFLLIVGAKNLNYNRILLIHLSVGLVILTISVVGAKIGLIKNIILYRGELNDITWANWGSSGRQSLGYVWPTGIAIHASFVLLCYWLMRKGKTTIVELLIYTFAAFFLYKETDTKQTFITIMILPLLSLVNRINLRRKSKMTFILCYSIPILTIFSLWITISYDSTDDFWNLVNIFSSGRLSLGQDSINKYGIPFWGQYFEMYGADVNSYNYNYIDSSYIQSFVLWGWPMTILLVSAYVYICKQACNRNDFPILFAVLVAGLSSVTSQYLFQIMSCPLLLALFANHKDYKKELLCQKKKN